MRISVGLLSEDGRRFNSFGIAGQVAAMKIHEFIYVARIAISLYVCGPGAYVSLTDGLLYGRCEEEIRKEVRQPAAGLG